VVLPRSNVTPSSAMGMLTESFDGVLKAEGMRACSKKLDYQRSQTA
jgi:hypothetical protein